MNIPGKYTWRSGTVDYPVTVIEDLGLGPDGRIYVKIKESLTAIPMDEIVDLEQEYLEYLETEQTHIDLEKYNNSRKPIPKRIFE